MGFVDLVRNREAIELLASSVPDEAGSDIPLFAIAQLRDHTKFERFRYYEAVSPPTLLPTDEVADEVVLVLAHAEPPYKEPVPRLSIKISETLLVPPYVAKVGSLHDLSADNAQQYEVELDLVGRSWVELPLVSGNTVLGKIAADWKGPPGDVSPNDLLQLDAFARTISGAMTDVESGQHAPLIESTFVGGFGSRPPDSKLHAGAWEVASAFLAEAGPHIDARCAALFVFDIENGTLEKEAEVIAGLPADGGGPVAGMLPETYAAGEFFTGRAWVNESARYVPNFEAFLKAAKELPGPTLVAPDSLAWHREILGGEVQVALYVTLGQATRRVLVRFMNRHLNPDVSYFSREATIAAVAPDFDRRIDMSYAREFSRVGTALTQNLVDPRQTSSPETYLAAALTEIGVGTAALLVIDGDGGHAGLKNRALIRRGLSRSVMEKLVLQAARDDALIDGALHGDQALVELEANWSVCRLSDLRPGGLAGALQDDGYTHCIAANRPERWGRKLLLVPLRRTEEIAAVELAERLLADHPFWLDTVLDCVDTYHTVTDHSLVMVPAFSLNAFRYLQHEIGEPLGSFGRDSLDMLREAHRYLLDAAVDAEGLIPDHVPTQIRYRLSQLGIAFEELRRVFDDMPLLGVGGQIQLAIEPATVHRIVRDAVGRTQRRFSANFRQRYEIPAYEIAVDVSRVMPLINVDKARLATALVCLLDNAVKYSMPTPVSEVSGGGRSQIAIRVRQVNDNVAFEVRSFGYAIPHFEDNRLAILEPFQRGNVRVGKTVPGMGLGLHFASSLAEAHGGRLAVARHEPQFSDRRRRETYGWLTEFQLTVPRDLEVGSRVFKPRKFVDPEMETS